MAKKETVFIIGNHELDKYDIVSLIGLAVMLGGIFICQNNLFTCGIRTMLNFGLNASEFQMMLAGGGIIIIVVSQLIKQGIIKLG